ncbi:hypothetical protein [Flavobacterium sp.]|uniref:hypothetical protein n=1 Tax=Flavobacterium sp. TaxID=239 RepID=UPI003C4F854D
MKDSTINTKQNAIIKRTLSLDEFIVKYIGSSKIEIKNLKKLPFDLKKWLQK